MYYPTLSVESCMDMLCHYFGPGCKAFFFRTDIYDKYATLLIHEIFLHHSLIFANAQGAYP
jgi:hypothetical protein